MSTAWCRDRGPAADPRVAPAVLPFVFDVLAPEPLVFANPKVTLHARLTRESQSVLWAVWREQQAAAFPVCRVAHGARCLDPQTVTLSCQTCLY
jgi:hypothetical protein